MTDQTMNADTLLSTCIEWYDNVTVDAQGAQESEDAFWERCGVNTTACKELGAKAAETVDEVEMMSVVRGLFNFYRLKPCDRRFNAVVVGAYMFAGYVEAFTDETQGRTLHFSWLQLLGQGKYGAGVPVASYVRTLFGNRSEAEWVELANEPWMKHDDLSIGILQDMGVWGSVIVGQAVEKMQALNGSWFEEAEDSDRSGLVKEATRLGESLRFTLGDDEMLSVMEHFLAEEKAHPEHSIFDHGMFWIILEGFFNGRFRLEFWFPALGELSLKHDYDVGQLLMLFQGMLASGDQKYPLRREGVYWVHTEAGAHALNMLQSVISPLRWEKVREGLRLSM